MDICRSQCGSFKNFSPTKILREMNFGIKNLRKKHNFKKFEWQNNLKISTLCNSKVKEQKIGDAYLKLELFV